MDGGLFMKYDVRSSNRGATDAGLENAEEPLRDGTLLACYEDCTLISR